MSTIAKVRAKGQTTIPRAVREALQVAPGDLIIWELESDGAAKVRRVRPADIEYLQAVEATLSEWASAADDEAYRDL